MESMATLEHRRPTATASATITACSARSITRRLAGASCPKTGCSHGNPWEFERAARSPTRSASAATSSAVEPTATRARRWTPAETVDRRRLRHADRRLARQAREHAAAVDGARARTRSGSRPSTRGDYVGALAEKRQGGDASPSVLYPSDATPARPGAAPAAGVLLHLRLAAGHRAPPPAAITAICATLAGQGGDPAQRHAPGRSPIAELMRILVDVHGIDVGRGLGHRHGAPFGYTNHTLLPEALESWPVPLFERAAAAPHADHLRDQRAASWREAPRSARLTTRCSRRAVADRRRAASAACAWPTSPSSARTRSTASSALHTDLMKQTVFARLRRAVPGRASTTRPTASRRGAGCRRPIPALAALIDRRASASGWLDDRGAAVRAAPPAPTTPPSSSSFAAVKRANKERAGRAHRATRMACGVDPDALFDVQVKRIHEYKRQLLNILADGRALRPIRGASRRRDWVPRVGDLRAARRRRATAWPSCIIKLINDVARRGQLRSRGRRPAQGGLPAQLQCRRWPR